MKTVTLITGGISSGKSAYALKLAQERHREQKGFFATDSAPNSEALLPVNDIPSVKNQPIFLAKEIVRAQHETDLVLIDCLTVWMNNLLFHFAGQPKMIDREIQNFLGVVGEKRTDMIFVTHEIGLGVMPENPAAKNFATRLGNLNQHVARLSDEVIFMVSGIPQVIKRSTVDADFDSIL